MGSRLERHGAGEAQHLLERDGADLAGAQRPLQRFPAEIAASSRSRVEHQIAAIGPVQRAGHDQIEIGEQRAEARHVLDAADQVLMGRVVLVDDRRALAGRHCRP